MIKVYDPVSSDNGSIADCDELGKMQEIISDNNHSVVDSECKHSPQCIIRQPLPPPLPKVTHLENNVSKYHLHMMSSEGVPGHYGGHDHCLNAYSKNYGCESCIWLKWHGNLHGFPDIHPGDYKKYLDTT